MRNKLNNQKIQICIPYEMSSGFGREVNYEALYRMQSAFNEKYSCYFSND